jgi:glycosyltransferase involved in cell wall biosynthesis
MDISVVIPLYNKADYIVRAIESVVQQTYTVREIIVVDDGSTDEGASRVQKLGYANVNVIRQSNHGVSHARNTGVDLASSEFIAFLDADDYWYPDFIQSIKELHSIYPGANLLCTGYEFGTSKGNKLAINSYFKTPHGVISDYFQACCNEDLPITASSVCLNKASLVDIGLFPEGLNLGEDQVVWAKMACAGSIAYMAKSCVVYDLKASGTDQFRIDYIEPSPHLYMFEELKQKQMVPTSLRDSLNYLQHLTVMSSVKSNLIHGRRRQAWKLLTSHPMLQWDLYRVFAFGMLLLTPSMNTWLFDRVKSRRA